MGAGFLNVGSALTRNLLHRPRNDYPLDGHAVGLAAGPAWAAAWVAAWVYRCMQTYAPFASVHTT